MKLEKIRNNHKNKFLIGGLISLGVLGIISIFPSQAKYKLTESIKIGTGEVNYKVPDFQIIAMYSSKDRISYTEITKMPESDYLINEEMSYCNINGEKDTEAILKTIEGNHIISNLQKGSKCFLYFNKILTSEDTLANLKITPNNTTPNFASAATTNEGVFKTEDRMYGDNAYSYYWRGAVTNNYVSFAEFCWRIVRINGDGSIRLIYDGTSCHANGTSTTESIAIDNTAYSSSTDKSEYVGWKYTSGKQRPTDTATGKDATIKTTLESWYTSKITNKGYNNYVADGKFCNDRNIATGSTWESTPSKEFHYATYERLYTNKTPTLKCQINDTYTLKVGLITADEVSFAGGAVATANSSYYLYNGQNYWTMSPYYWNSSNRWAMMFLVIKNGNLNVPSVNGTTQGIRPIINLKSDTTFSSGNGTQNTPYVVQ